MINFNWKNLKKLLLRRFNLYIGKFMIDENKSVKEYTYYKKEISFVNSSANGEIPWFSKPEFIKIYDKNKPI